MQGHEEQYAKITTVPSCFWNFVKREEEQRKAQSYITREEVISWRLCSTCRAQSRSFHALSCEHAGEFQDAKQTARLYAAVRLRVPPLLLKCVVSLSLSLGPCHIYYIGSRHVGLLSDIHPLKRCKCSPQVSCHLWDWNARSYDDGWFKSMSLWSWWKMISIIAFCALSVFFLA